METKLEIKGKLCRESSMIELNAGISCLNIEIKELSKTKTKNLYPESKLPCHRHAMILTDNTCFKVKTFLGKIIPP